VAPVTAVLHPASPLQSDRRRLPLRARHARRGARGAGAASRRGPADAQRYEVAPHPESLFERAEARDRQSRADVSAPENRGRGRVAPAW